MHRNAPAHPEGRLRLCQRIVGGWPVAHTAETMGISGPRLCVVARYQEEGVAGLLQRVRNGELDRGLTTSGVPSSLPSRW
jgi:leucine-zipper of insertion element IS481